MIDIKQVGEPRVLTDDSGIPDKYIISARMSTMRARFFNSYEVTNGNPVWEIAVYGDTTLQEDTTPLWQGLEEHDHCFQVPICYVPFTHSGYTLCYDLLESGTHIYNFTKETRVKSEVKGFWSILCAPKEPMILIGGTEDTTRQNGVYLVDYSGKILRRLESLDDTPDAYLSWLMYKPTILAISKKSKKHKTWISEIDSKTDQVLQKRSFDPQDILPYDDLSYSQYLDEYQRLRIEHGYAPDGLLGNKWSGFEYDYGFKKLRARICHPPIEYLQSEDRPKTNGVEGVFYEYTFMVDLT